MITTILDEVVNGWVLTLYPSGEKFIYETHAEAAMARDAYETREMRGGRSL